MTLFSLVFAITMLLALYMANGFMNLGWQHYERLKMYIMYIAAGAAMASSVVFGVLFWRSMSPTGAPMSIVAWVVAISLLGINSLVVHEVLRVRRRFGPRQSVSRHPK